MGKRKVVTHGLHEPPSLTFNPGDNAGSNPPPPTPHPPPLPVGQVLSLSQSGVYWAFNWEITDNLVHLVFLVCVCASFFCVFLNCEETPSPVTRLPRVNCTTMGGIGGGYIAQFSGKIITRKVVSCHRQSSIVSVYIPILSSSPLHPPPPTPPPDRLHSLKKTDLVFVATSG